MHINKRTIRSKQFITSITLTIMVKSISIAIKFYISLLGLKLKQQYGDHYTEIEGPGILIGLYQAEGKINVGNNVL
ncbi:MAG: hypothetical protein DWQ44_13520 [Bacteroidetes bacterium]|nr:MAG: hypothetical protein DWQ33_08330 [Bacteroidota bacterium]REK05719.1 MAG: hypothetical protein DWQ39_04725 [Bacteroidota bacterium]REK31975.1 MAG: hypothetical protein DWQ44_13520 [Bacteroidota bacterium]